MNDIEMKQYKNLRECFNTILINPILGENYYNMAMDVYNVDEECCEDIKRKYDNLQYNYKIYKRLFIVMTIISILLIFK
ncbi:hypothetical protein [Clostridium sp. KNHs214]|uniref:hypothetical protein n=1 Tax=Clostridium sp. KNHs214 TaxID=1540257 RepID=UPI00163ACCB5|nr:hypothetical protein [Clostridium sp. KNHs214]